MVKSTKLGQWDVWISFYGVPFIRLASAIPLTNALGMRYRWYKRCGPEKKLKIKIKNCLSLVDEVKKLNCFNKEAI